jgi:dimethylamine--corrinoid protein Co-methyltransferase
LNITWIWAIEDWKIHGGAGMLKIRTRYGDGTALELSESELREDLENGTADAAECGMKIQPAKKYVADKLGVSVPDLTDPVIMTEVRDDLQIGVMTPLPGCAKGIEAKFRIAELLDIDIGCVRRFRKKISL